MAKKMIVRNCLRYNGKEYNRGEEVTIQSDKEAERLFKIEAAYWKSSKEDKQVKDDIDFEKQLAKDEAEQEHKEKLENQRKPSSAANKVIDKRRAKVSGEG